MHQGIKKYSRIKPKDSVEWKEFSKRLHYLQGEYDDPKTYVNLKEKLSQLDGGSVDEVNYLFYLATPPSVYRPVIKQTREGRAEQTECGKARHRNRKAVRTSI